MMKLQQAFDISRGDIVSFIGAGDKTSAILKFANELADDGWRVVIINTAPMSVDMLRQLPHVSMDTSVFIMSAMMSENRYVSIFSRIEGETVVGMSSNGISALVDTIDSDVILVKADNANNALLKAPFAHEPMIPAESSHVIVSASLNVLGKPLNAEHVYNPEAIIERYGFTADAAIKSPWVAQVLRDDELGLKGIPKKARVFGLLNHTPARGYLRARSRMIARLMLNSPRISGVALGIGEGENAIPEVQRSVGAVVLAAGMSQRMGEPKVLLPWSGRKTIIEQIIEQLILAKVHPITVVTGNEADKVRFLAERMGVKVVHNRRYATGEMLSSVKVGLKAMPAHVMGALIVLGDQPRIQARVINQVTMAYAEGKGRIVAPSYQMQRGHPLLIDRRYWPEILRLKAKNNLRQVINAHADEIAYVKVNTDSVLRDVDTPEDYAGERSRAGLDGA